MSESDGLDIDDEHMPLLTVKKDAGNPGKNETQKSETALRYTFMLFGKTGSGKSATGNTLLGKPYFATSPSSKSCTQNIGQGDGNFQDNNITVIDTPGIHDTQKDMLNTLQTIYQGVSRVSEGLNAFLFVLRIGDRCTKEMLESFKAFKRSFGSNIAKNNGIIVFTFGDAFPEPNNDTIVEWCQNEDNVEKGSELHELLKECNYKVVVFNNKDQSKREECLTQLFKHLRPQAPRYTKEDFKKCAESRDAYVTSIGFIEQRPHIDGAIQKENKLQKGYTIETTEIKERKRDIMALKVGRYVGTGLLIVCVGAGSALAALTGVATIPLISGALWSSAAFAGGVGSLGGIVYANETYPEKADALKQLEDKQTVESKAQSDEELKKKKAQ